MENTPLPRSEVAYKNLCRDMLLFSEDKTYSKKDASKYMTFHKCIKMLSLLTEVRYGTLT